MDEITEHWIAEQMEPYRATRRAMPVWLKRDIALLRSGRRLPKEERERIAKKHGLDSQGNRIWKESATG